MLISTSCCWTPGGNHGRLRPVLHACHVLHHLRLLDCLCSVHRTRKHDPTVASSSPLMPRLAFAPARSALYPHHPPNCKRHRDRRTCNRRRRSCHRVSALACRHPRRRADVAACRTACGDTCCGAAAARRRARPVARRRGGGYGMVCDPGRTAGPRAAVRACSLRVSSHLVPHDRQGHAGGF